MQCIFTSEQGLSVHANIHVNDVVQAFLLATLNRRAYGQVCNLAHPRPSASVQKTAKALDWKPLRTEELCKRGNAER